jgi:hypothetical protein
MNYRNRVFSMYRFRSGTYWYVLSTLADWYRKSESIKLGIDVFYH